MKKCIALILTFVLLFCLCGCKKQDNTKQVNDELIIKNISVNEIENNLLKELENENLSNIETIEIFEKYAKQWEKIAEDCYTKLMNLDRINPPNKNYPSVEDFHNAITNIKTDWEKHYKKEIKNYKIVLESEYQAGTIVPLFLAEYDYNMKKDFAWKFINIYEQINN